MTFDHLLFSCLMTISLIGQDFLKCSLFSSQLWLLLWLDHLFELVVVVYGEIYQDLRDVTWWKKVVYEEDKLVGVGG